MSEKISALTAKTTLADNDVFVIVDSADGLNKKVSFKTINEKAGGLYTIARRVTSAEILNIYASPVEIIPSPGAGKAIVLNNVAYKVDFNSTPYDSTGLQLYTDTSTYPQSSGIPTQSSVTNIQLVLIQPNFDPSDSGQVVENKALLLKSAGGGSPASGDSDFIIYLTYQIIDLTI